MTGKRKEKNCVAGSGSLRIIAMQKESPYDILQVKEFDISTFVKEKRYEILT